MAEPIDPVTFLEGLAAELAEIHRGKHFAQWRPDAVQRTDRALEQAEPFRAYAATRIFAGDGMTSQFEGRLGNWAVDRLVDKLSPSDIFEAFHAEVARNNAVYEEVSPAIGIAIEQETELEDGVRLVPPSASILDIEGYSHRYRWGMLPEGTGFLVQSYRVTPAFAPATQDSLDEDAVVTEPDRATRDAVRERFRRACLLVSPGGVELPVSVIAADRHSLFQVDGNSASRPHAARPHTAMPVDTGALRSVYASLAQVDDRDIVERAIDRLGRSRLSLDPVDRALDLGMAAEIVLMHDAGQSNAEITYKILSRAAWLVASEAGKRAEIFDRMRDLYAARSKAVYTGRLPAKKPVDLDAADRLVTRVIRVIVDRGGFPDWKRLALGDG